VILPDVNVLLYAFRSDVEQHAAYRAWLEGVVNGDMAYGMSPQVLAGVIRLATHPRVFARPDPLADVLTFVNVLLDQPHCQIIEPGRRHWGIFTAWRTRAMVRFLASSESPAFIRTDTSAASALGNRNAKRDLGVPATLVESNTTSETKLASSMLGLAVSPYSSASLTRLSWKRPIVTLFAC